MEWHGRVGRGLGMVAVLGMTATCGTQGASHGSEVEPGIARVVTKIGDDDTRGTDYEFGSVAAVALDSGGRIYVADQGDSRIRVYSADGDFEQSIGREGQGPGEFRVPVDMGFSADGALWVRDLTRIQRFVSHSPGSVPDSVVRIQTLTGYPSFDRAGVGDSLYYCPGYFFPLNGGARYFFEVFAPNGVVDTLNVPELPKLARTQSASYRNGRVGREERALIGSLNRAPFEALPVWRITEGGNLLVSSGQEPVVREIAPGRGPEVVREFRLPFARMAVPQAAARDSLAALKSRLARISVSLDDIANVSELVLQGALPDSLPTVLNIHRGVDGTTWVEVWPGAPGTTDFVRFDSHGVVEGYYRLPVALATVPPDFRGDRAVGVTRDPDTGVETVVLFQMPAGGCGVGDVGDVC